MPSLTISLSLKSRLRSSTRGDSYGVLGFNPSLVFDFKNNYFRKSATDSTFGASITHAATTNATMVDSDGLLKWRPHNLIKYSEDFNNINWTKVRITLAAGQNDFEGNPTAFKIAPTAVSGTHAFYKQMPISNLVDGILSTVTIDLKADGYNFFSISTNGNRYAIFNLSDGSVSLDTNSVSPTVTSLGNGWYRCSITSSVVSQEVFSVVETPQAANHGATTFTGDGTSGVLVAYPHSFRSDLGGMVNNPDTTSSYVPTTTSVVYAPRRGQHIYNGSAWVNEGILHESEARTNLLLNSSVLNYIKLNTATSTSTVVSPSGLQDAVLVQPTVATGVTWVYDPDEYNTGVVTTISTFAKASGKSFLTTANSNGTFVYSSFNLTTGAVGTVASGYTANMEDFGNGWYRCSVTTPTGFNERAIYAVSDTDNAISAAANGNDGILLYGAQLEAGATPSSYIPTTSAQVTRASETLTVPASNLPYDNTNMSIQIDGKMTYADSDNINEVQPYYWTLNGPNYIYARVSTSGTRSGQPTFLQRETTSGNDFVNGIPNAYTPDTNVPFNLASRHGSTFINGAHEGTLLTVNTTPTILPDLSSTDLDLGFDFMGTIGEFRMWSDDLGDVGITEATLPSTEPSLSLTFDGSENSFIVLDWSE
jgi:hypothetical protein